MKRCTMVAKVCVLIICCLWCVQFSHQKPERCLQAPEPGPCYARIPRLYYDAATNSCKEFIYGGCSGNSNNFETINDCDSACVTEQESQGSGDRCSLHSDPGPCKASIQRMYYDTDSNSCKEFTYGGCGGNDNNFVTLDHCETACVKNTTSGVGRCFLKPEAGLCRARIPRLYYDVESNTCKEFIYGGCGGNTNNFENLHECDEACVSMSRPGATKCYLAMVEGPCKMNLPRMYYDPQENKCKEFIYGGCEGNDNNFENTEDCESACVQKESDNICALKADPGPCKGSMFRYYYNSATQQCGEFIYGGCRGNKNKFETLNECIQSCDNSATTFIMTSFQIVIVCLTLISL